MAQDQKAGQSRDAEGWIEPDLGADEDENMGRYPGQSPEEQELTTAACADAIDSLRNVMTRVGRRPVRPLRVLGGAIMKVG